jgi:hypothetical protein
MPNELGPIRSTGKAVIINPDNDIQCRNVTTGTWVAMASATFSDCAIALAQDGTTGNYYADLPAGTDATRKHTFLLYSSTATEFSDADVSAMEYSPEHDVTLATQESIDAIKDKTDNIPSDPATNTLVAAVGSAVAALGTPQQAGTAVTLPTIPAGWLTSIQSSTTGTGPYVVTVTVTDGTDPIGSARVRLGDYFLTTDENGQAVFHMDAGTYAYAATRGGYVAAAGSKSVTDDTTLAVELDKLVANPPDAAGYATGRASMPGAVKTLTITQVDVPADPGVVYTLDITPVTVTANDQDIAEYTSFQQGGRYKIQAESGEPITITVPYADYFNIQGLAGVETPDPAP